MNAYFLSDVDVRKLRDIARRVGSGRSSQRPVSKRRRNPNGGASARKTETVEFLITKTIQGASFDAPANKLTPVTFVAKVLESSVSLDGTFETNEETGEEVRVVSFFTQGITVSAGKARIAVGMRVSGQPWTLTPWDDLDPTVSIKLYNVDCNEIDYTGGSTE